MGGGWGGEVAPKIKWGVRRAEDPPETYINLIKTQYKLIKTFITCCVYIIYIYTHIIKHLTLYMKTYAKRMLNL